MPDGSDLVDSLGRLALFADLTRPELEALAHTVDEEVFAEGQRILRKGLSGSGFFVILEGQAAVEVDGERPWTLGPGDFFGEASVLTGEPPSADVVATSLLRCVIVAGPDLERFLLDRPQLMLRLLRAEAQRLRTALAWRS
ncbi:MAG: cyclic nucleotide-binding domain-containing protein [Gaiellaceae bacterium]|jgi:CRP-like cAMP-binding protein